MEHDLFGKPLHTFPNHALASCSDAFSSREPVPTSLENALEAGRRTAVLKWLRSGTMLSDRGATFRPRWEDRDEAILHSRGGGFFRGRHLGFAGPGGAADGDAVTGI
jgi:hypothetical protein